jgi:hypothetical protein
MVRAWRLAVSLSVFLMLGGLLAPAAGAATAPTAISTAPFTLSADYDRYDGVTAELDTRLPKVTVPTVMTNANIDRGPLCKDLGLTGPVVGFCWSNASPNDEGDCQNVPQGITTTRDATGGDYLGHQLVAVSWYHQTDCTSSAQTNWSRITLVDWDASPDRPNRYRKVLLVEPKDTPAGPSFTDVPIHVGGISWYGDYLYVADTNHGIRVFDMSRIWETDTSGTGIGLQADGSYQAHGYRYVLPQAGMISDVGSTRLTWSALGLDRVQPSLVMGEFKEDSGSHAVRFPLDATTHRLQAGGDGLVHATEALSVPYVHVQGVVSHNGRWWFASSSDKELYYWVPGGAATAHSWVSYCEGLSYWADSTNPDMLWTLREQEPDRQVFAVQQQYYD